MKPFALRVREETGFDTSCVCTTSSGLLFSRGHQRYTSQVGNGPHHTAPPGGDAQRDPAPSRLRREHTAGPVASCVPRHRHPPCGQGLGGVPSLGTDVVGLTGSGDSDPVGRTESAWFGPCWENGFRRFGPHWVHLMILQPLRYLCCLPASWDPHCTFTERWESSAGLS